MAADRSAVGLVVAMLLVWSVAFGGGYSIALFSATAGVSGTFESVDAFEPIESEVDAALTGAHWQSSAERNESATNESIENNDRIVNATDPGKSGADPSVDGDITDPGSADGNTTDGRISDEPSKPATNVSDVSEDTPAAADPIDDEEKTADASDDLDTDGPTDKDDPMETNGGTNPTETDPTETEDGSISVDSDTGEL